MASTICWNAWPLLIGLRVTRGLRLQLMQDLLDAILSGHRLIVDELQLRSALQAEPPADLPPQERSHALERTRGVRAALVVAKRGVHHPCLLQIRAHMHARQRDEPDAGVVHFSSQHLRKLAAELVGDAFGTGTLRHL